MTTVQSEVFEAFRDGGAAEDKALKAACALSKRVEDIATLSKDLAVVEWMMSLVLAFEVASFIKDFIR